MCSRATAERLFLFPIAVRKPCGGGGRQRGEMTWKSCRSHKTPAYVEPWRASEFLDLVLPQIATLHMLSNQRFNHTFFHPLYQFVCFLHCFSNKLNFKQMKLIL